MVQMLSPCGATRSPGGRGGRQFPGSMGSHTGTERRQGPGIQSWPDGSTYEGHFVNGLKHGSGKFTWNNGEYYEGSFFKDYRHGKGVYCWPTEGCTFIGKFYLNRKEGYGQQQFPDGTTFRGLYHADQRFGPGVVTYPDGGQDVGLWHRERLLKLCTSIEGGFTLNSFPEYAEMSPAATVHPLTQLPCRVSGPEAETRTLSEMSAADPLLSPYSDLLSDERFILPCDMEVYSTDGDHLPVPPGLRTQLDLHFYGELWEAGYDYDPTPLSAVPLQLRMQANIHRHR